MPGTTETEPKSAATARRALEYSSTGDMEVTIAPNAGACFGVVRAIKLGHKAIVQNPGGGKVFSFGPLIHNPTVVKELSDLGLNSAGSEEEIQDGTVVLRSHGVRKEIEGRLRDKGVEVVDATCPLVKKPQRIATSLGEKGYFLVLVGDKKHPEVQGVLSYYGLPSFLVTYCDSEVALIPDDVRKVAVIAQTTIEYKVFDAVVSRCRERFEEVVVHNTICDATSVRQREADSLARLSDVMIVVGGRNSSNTRKLEKICRDLQPNTYLIEEMSEVDRAWFEGKRKIGVTGGASTPMEFVDRVGVYIADLLRSSRSN